MDRLVGDQLLQEGRRRLPGDAPQVQEADIEPGLQQVAQVVVERFQGRRLAQQRQQVGTHVDQELHPFGQHIELGQKPQPRRHQGLAQSPLRRQTLGLLFGFMPFRDLGLDRVAVGPELLGQERQKLGPALLVQLQIGFAQARRAHARGDLAAARGQAVGHELAQRFGIAQGRVRPL